MAQGAGSVSTVGMVGLNAAQSTANINTVPTAILDDPVNGAVVSHLGGRGVAPTIAVVIAGAGTAGTAAPDTYASDLCGKITLVTGSGAWGTGAQANITFGTPFSRVVYPSVEPADAATSALFATLKPYVVPIGLTGFALSFQVADSAAHTLNFFYFTQGN